MLTGIKVVDLTRVLAGPLCTMMLGDLGADVIKVERPDEGDETRGWGPPFDERGESAYYLSINRNKLGIALDLDNEADRAELLGLVSTADVVVENFKPGTLERRGLGAVALRERFPQLVWCTIAGFAHQPGRPGYDFVAQAESGWMSITGEPSGAPMKHGIALVDVLAGKEAAIAILAALVARAQSGIGREVRITLQQTAEAALLNVAQNWLVSGSTPRRWGNAHANLVPYQLFEAADRSIVIAAGNDAQWAMCARTLGLDDLASDARLRTNAGRLEHREYLVARLGARLKERNAREWCALLERVGVPTGVVKTVPEILADAGASPLTGMPPSIPGSVRLPPPRLGEHQELIRSLGWAAFRQTRTAAQGN